MDRFITYYRDPALHVQINRDQAYLNLIDRTVLLLLFISLIINNSIIHLIVTKISMHLVCICCRLRNAQFLPIKKDKNMDKIQSHLFIGTTCLSLLFFLHISVSLYVPVYSLVWGPEAISGHTLPARYSPPTYI